MKHFMLSLSTEVIKPYIAIPLLVEYTIQHFCRAARPQKWESRTKIERFREI